MNYSIRFVFFYFFLFHSCNLASGSYPYAEKYEVNYPEDSIIEAIKIFKKKNPEFIVPKVTIDDKNFWNLEDDKSKKTLWYSFYFYYKEENQIIFTWIRSRDDNRTTIALVSVNNGLKIGQWKKINKDLSISENKEQKNKFENRILTSIKEYLKHSYPIE